MIEEVRIARNDGSPADALPDISRVANFLDAAMPSNYQSRIDGPP